MADSSTPQTILRRLRSLAEEPAVRKAREPLDRAAQARQTTHRELRDLSDRIAEAEIAAADALLSGDDPDDREDLQVLRIARQRKREELQLRDRALTIAQDRHQEALEAAKAAMAGEYTTAHQVLLEEVEAAVDAAMRINTQLRDLEYAGRQALGNQVPHDLALSWLVPAAENSDTKYAAWKNFLNNFRKGQK